MINPQAPNTATGTSLRVCWGLFSDDTVECYQLCYKPVSNERSSDEQAGKEAWTQGDTSALHWQNQLVPKCLWTCCGNQCTFCALSLPPKLSYLPPHFLLLSLSHFPSQVCHAVSCSRTHHRSRQDGASAGIAGVGRGQCQVSTVAFLFLEGRQCIRYTCAASTAKHSIFREQIIILSAHALKPPQSFYSLSQC